jgi:LCP family protein required for cell wall assembly
VRRSIIIALAAVPVTIALIAWLMLHGHLDLVVVLLVLAVVAMGAAAVWEWRHGHRRWSALLVAGVVLTVGTVGGYGWSLNHQIEKISRAPDSDLDTGARPAAVENHAINILLMGADNPRQLVKKPTVGELLADGTWDPGAYRSDTMMVVHVPKDRKAAYVVSVPRDSYVRIYDSKGRQHGHNKINEAFAAYGPYGTWRTIENLSGVRIDHMAIIDYAGFRELTEAVGGVDVYIPETVYDSKQDQTWTRGNHHIEGDLALSYVRMRHGLLNGDFDRIDRQQNFLRTLLGKVLADDTIGNPVKFSKTLAAITDHLTVDQGWSNHDLRGLAIGLRGLDSQRIRFMTLPLLRYQDGSSNIIDTQAARQLWKAVLDDTVGPYLKAHPDDELPDPQGRRLAGLRECRRSVLR